MRWTSFNDLLLWPDSPEVPGVVTDLGSTFRNPSAAVAMGEHRLEVFGAGTDYALYHKSYSYQPGDSWSAERECLGGDLTSTPVVVSTAAERLDIFVLGPDQGLLHRRRTGSAWSAWKELGGCFTSAPAVLPTGLDTFDIFAHRPDYLIYQSRLTAVGFSGWETLGSGLLREPIAASAPAVARVQDEMYVFVVAADLATWFTRLDGNLWKPWSSLGRKFVSNPVAIALFPEIDRTQARAARIDVFGIRSGDHVLLHNWLEKGLVNRGLHGWIAGTDGPTAAQTGRYRRGPGAGALTSSGVSRRRGRCSDP